MRHQFQIGISGYTSFPAIGDPTPVRLLPPPVAPLRFVRRKKRKAFASWDQKVRLIQVGSAVEKFPLPKGRWGEEPTAQEVYEHALSWGMSHKKAWDALCNRRDLLTRAKMNGVTIEEQEARESRDNMRIVGKRMRGE